MAPDNKRTDALNGKDVWLTDLKVVKCMYVSILIQTPFLSFVRAYLKDRLLFFFDFLKNFLYNNYIEKGEYYGFREWNCGRRYTKRKDRQ